MALLSETLLVKGVGANERAAEFQWQKGDRVGIGSRNLHGVGGIGAGI